ncbi:uncharacterized protein LOC124342763 [Daphnia pulicaria]|uniref:uncharacterized protein LOC124342763 n=1 Tax=Daphnia pulicaria TaxID=35523 RepID=UPI001EEBD695|nr:uncharacterized protein LOC124342763 [Daphnia pulicaria]
MSFLASPSNMETNMDIMNSFNNFVMDDPTTPLCIPVCNSFDQEFQLQENIHLNMLPQNTTLKFSGTAEASPTNALPHQPDEQIELPLDLFDYLENVPFNIEELIKEEDSSYGTVLCDAGSYHSQTNRRRNSNADVQMSVEPSTPPPFEFVEVQHPIQIKTEDVEMNYEEMCSFSSISNYQMEENVKRESLHLNLPPILQPVTTPSEGVVTTPVLINMLLEKEEIRKQIPEPVDIKPTLVYSDLPLVLQDISSDSATESSLPPTPISRARTNTKRASNNSDIRRVRNNEASRKSRQNRRNKLQTQAQLVDVLEEEGRRLSNQIKELELLKAEIMKYMTGSNKLTTTP